MTDELRTEYADLVRRLAAEHAAIDRLLDMPLDTETSRRLDEADQVQAKLLDDLRDTLSRLRRVRRRKPLSMVRLRMQAGVR